MTQRTKRNWHSNFLKYMKFIVNHPNYNGMPFPYKNNGKIQWVVTRSSKNGLARLEWWDKKREKLGILKDGAWRSKTARAIHPKKLHGLKTCQICGKELSIFYIYPNKNSLKKLNAIAPEFQFSSYKENIDEIVNTLSDTLGEEGLSALKTVFGVPVTVQANKNSIAQYIKANRESRLSPGAMSDSPDRLDGFHTYDACCRPIEDTGRYTTNLARYTQDRRVYENWADGNWNLSNRLMGEFNKYELEIKCPSCGNIRKMTADHTGPISLGFTHRPKFNPLCRECNSSKNNRMTLDDIKMLIADEKGGEQIMSWHSRYMWDLIKYKVKTQSDALKLSKLMRLNLHHILILFSKISEEGYNEFLKKYLHPEYSYMDYKFLKFHPLTGAEKILEKPLDSTNKKKNAQRYVRVSFESLEEYKKIENRSTKIWQSKRVDELINNLLKLLSGNRNRKAELILLEVIQQLALESDATFDAMS